VINKQIRKVELIYLNKEYEHVAGDLRRCTEIDINNLKDMTIQNSGTTFFKVKARDKIILLNCEITKGPLAVWRIVDIK